MKEEDIKSGIMKENFPMDKLIEQLENNVLKSRNDTENIQDLINERNKQNKRIEELVLEIERLNNIINELEKYFAKPNKFIERPERMKILDKLKALKEDNK